MAITRIKSSNINADAVNSEHLVDGSVDDAHLATDIDAGKLINALPILDGSNLTGVAPTKTTVEALGIELPAANLTGTIANARISESAVTQHVTATDLTPVHQSIATLGLHMGVSANAAAYNLPNAFIDTFEDDTGITTETDVDRDTAGEYISSVSESFGTPAYVTGNRASSITLSTNAVTNGSAQNLINGTTASFYFGNQNVSGLHFTFQWTVKQKITEARWYNDESDDSQGQGYWKWQGSNDGTTWTDIGGDFQLINTGMVGGAGGYQELTTLGGNTTGYFYYKMLGVSGTCGTYSNHQELDFKQGAASTTSNATGTLISDTQTAPAATTEVSGVILYKDNAGTNTLGTDLKVYMTANNGTNWTEAASYGTAQTFSGTTKQVKLGKTTVTSGTAIAMKAVWANQAATVGGGYDSGDRTSTITVTTDQSVGSGAITNLVDGATSNGCYFTPNGFAVTGKYIRFQFSSAKVIIETTFYHQGHTGEHLGTWKWQGSNNGSSWTDISDDYILCDAQTSQEITAMSLSSVTNSTAYTYYQLLGVSGTGHSEWINEMTFKEAGVTGKEAQLHGWAVNY